MGKLISPNKSDSYSEKYMSKQVIQQIKQRFSIIGVSHELERAIDTALQVAPTDLSVLITGESGVGKENFPQIIHLYSRRKHGPYFAVNCGSIPEGTIDSELFGHEKGAFTGATSSRKGYFESADAGTLFLDEVGELPLSTQARLLRVLETGEFIKVGSSKVEKSNVRVVAATNMNMIKAVEKGKFREDLYYRLNSVPIRIAPLRDRKDDIPLLFRKFSGDCAERYMMPPITLTEEAKELLKSYRWPGNIRQLKNITEQISVIEQERVITPEIMKRYLPLKEVGMLPVLASHSREGKGKTFANEREILYQVLFDMKKDLNDLKQVVRDLMSKGSDSSSAESDALMQDNLSGKSSYRMPVKYSEKFLQTPFSEIDEEEENDDDDIQDAAEYIEEAMSLQEVEEEMIIKALERHDGNRRFAARDLKISERTLYRKIKDYKLEDL